MSRKPGTQNKLTVDVKNMINQAFVCAGGVKYLVRQAEKEPKAFMALLGRIVPATVAVSVSTVFLDLGKAMLDSEQALKRLTIDGDRVSLDHDATTSRVVEVQSDIASRVVEADDEITSRVVAEDSAGFSGVVEADDVIEARVVEAQNVGKPLK